MPRYWLWLLLLVPPIVQAAAPSQEFWEYMADYSDENGEVLDPLELEEAIAAREQGGFESEQTSREAPLPVESDKVDPDKVESDKSALEQRRMKNVHLKATGKSSATNASRQGARL